MNNNLDISINLMKKMSFALFKNYLLSHLIIKMGKHGVLIVSRVDVSCTLSSDNNIFASFNLTNGQENILQYTKIDVFEKNVNIVSTSGAGIYF